MSSRLQTVLVSGVRTPIGSFQGRLATYSAPKLGGLVMQAALERAGVPAEKLSEVIMGCVLSAGLGQAPARQAAKAAGIPNEIGALTINKVCGSSLKAIVLADQMIRAGDAEVLLAGGMESMSNAPYLLPKVREGLRLGNGQVLDSMILDGLWDPYNDFHMGNAGERCAKKVQISREAQDAFARRSYERAHLAQKQGWFRREILEIRETNSKTGEVSVFADDEEIARGYSKIDKMNTLKGAFEKDGTITAANASKLSDGAAAVLVMSEAQAQALSIPKRFRVAGFAQAAMSPEDFPIAPVEAIRRLSRKTGVALSQIDRFEINEAFSVVGEACIRQLELDPARVNARGGAVALGHPIGASGARIVVTLMHQLEDDKLQRGVAAICLGGGEAVALMIERVA